MRQAESSGPHRTPFSPQGKETADAVGAAVARAPQARTEIFRAVFTLYMVTIIEIYNVKTAPQARTEIEARLAVRARPGR